MPLGRGGPGLIGTMARTAVISGTATAVSGRVARRQQARYAQQDGQLDAQRQVYAEEAYVEQTPAAAPAAAPDYTAELTNLAKLRDDGVITAEDFEAKKKQLLGL